MHVNIYTYAYMYIYKYMSNLQTYIIFCTFAATFAVQRPLQATFPSPDLVVPFTQKVVFR